MSIPSAIFLDTTVFDSQAYNFSSVAFTSLIAQAKAKDLPLILPDPTKREIERHIRDRSAEAREALIQARRAAPFLAKWRHFPKLRELRGGVDDWEIAHIASAEWRSFLANFRVVELDYSDVRIDEVMNWYDAVRAPFGTGKKRKEFPDALAIAALSAYANHNHQYIAMVSADKDFGAACEHFTYLMHFRTLPALVELLLADDSRLKQARSIIDASTTALIEAAEEAIGRTPIVHTQSEFNDDLEAASIDSVTISEVRVVALGERECTVAFDVNIEFGATLHWIERPVHQPYRGDPDDLPYLEEHRFQRSRDVSDYNEMLATAKVRFTEDFTKLDKVVSMDLAEDELVMSETPWMY